jgi:hypothetical protein
MQSLERTHDSKDLRYRNRNKPQRLAYLGALCLLPVLTTSLVLWAVLHTWHLQSSLTHLYQNHQHHQHHHQPPSTNTHHQWTTCGTSPTEAQSRNCRFDILSFAWQTPECFDDELMQDFIHYGGNNTWQFYTHPNRTDSVVSLAIALEGQRTLYVDWAYHVTHCTFMWRQMHRAYAVRGYVDSHLDSYEHTLHCQGVLLARDVGLGVVNVVAEVKYPGCRKIVGV